MPDASLAIHAYLSEESRKAWGDFALANGCSITALLEVLGLELAEEEEEAEPHREQWVIAARRVDGIRRRRGGSRRK